MAKIRFGQESLYSLGRWRLPFAATHSPCKACRGGEATHMVVVLLDGALETLRLCDRHSAVADARINGVEPEALPG